MKSNPVFWVPARIGIDCSAAMTSEKGESLICPSSSKVQRHKPIKRVPLPQIRAIARSREDRLVRALRVVVVLTTAQARRAVRLRAVGVTLQLCQRCQRSVTPGNKEAARGSMCRSEMCRTFRRCPDAFFGAGSGSGLGLENQPVRLRGVVGGSGHRPERKCEQIICSPWLT